MDTWEEKGGEFVYLKARTEAENQQDRCYQQLTVGPGQECGCYSAKSSGIGTGCLPPH